MRPALALSVVISIACSLATAQTSPGQLMEAFRQPYSGEDATGKHVIALWQFDAGAELRDASGHGHDLQLNGATPVAEGRFGGALESARGWPVEDKPHQAVAKNSPALSPKGAFTLEMWINPRPELKGYGQAYLVDKKYVDNTDYQLTLSAETSPGMRMMIMRLGFGADTVTYNSKPFSVEPGTWRHLAFTYDGAGTGRFFVDGRAAGLTIMPGRGAVVPGTKNLCLGDRIGSYYGGFPGLMDQVRLCNGALEFTPAGFKLTSLRKVFVRMEQAATLQFEFTNRQREPLAGAKAFISLGGMPAQQMDLPELAPGATHVIDYPVDTRVRPDTYTLAATVETPGDPPLRSTEEFQVTVVPRPLPHLMPVVMWGAGLGEVPRLKDLGFTHAVGLGADFGAIWDAGKPIPAAKPEAVAKAFAEMDNALANGIGVVASLSPGSWARGKPELRRVGRDGKPYEKGDDICAMLPELATFCENVGASVAQTYGSHPDLQAALIHTEVRDGTALCFHEHDRKAFRNFAGYDIPETASTKWGVQYQTIEDFPKDRVIPDDYPLYVYYKWFWKQGDGWNALHTALNKGLKSTGRTDLWTFHDPAARCPSVYGSGGDVDYLSHWTYSYPDPIRIGLCTDELFCMAGGRPGQKVMKMTQIIWYRSQTAPEPGDEVRAQTGTFQDKDVRPQGTGTVDAGGRYVAGWEREQPDARFPTIAPMHLREAFWTKISRPIQGLMYHGWQSLVPVADNSGAYRYTHPETKLELRRLVKSVVEPLGPTLVQTPDRPADVGFLESFASQMLARRGTYGWNGGWAGDAYLILEYAQLQPRVLYEETVLQGGLDGLKALVMVDCDVLPRSVADKILAFQQAGGLLIGDENLCPAIKPDILLPSHARPKEADKARALMLEKAAALRKELDAKYQRYAESSNPDVLTRVRSYGSTDYVFVVNDLREFGNYVGHHGLVMENGLPSKTTLTLRRTGVVLYDLVRHRDVQAQGGGDTVTLEVSLGPCEGAVFMVSEEPIGGVRIEAPETAKPGDPMTIRATVVDEQGSPLDAIVPVRVEILDPDGRPTEFSGYYGAKDGRLEIRAHLAPNDVPGLWRVHVEELASGREAEAYVRVASGE